MLLLQHISHLLMHRGRRMLVSYCLLNHRWMLIPLLYLLQIQYVFQEQPR